MRTRLTPTARTLAATVVLSTAALTLMQMTAFAHPQHGGGSDSEDVRDAKQHDSPGGHLPAAQENVQLIGQTSLKNVVPEKIADVGVYNGFAYVAAWGSTTCKYNGVHVVDMADLSKPREVAFVPSKEGSYPGEGVQATAISTKAFNGDILVTNNEKCNEKTGFGGLNIYDVSNPKRPTPLAVGIGDTTSEGVSAASGQGKKQAHSIHSVFAWDAGDRAYVAIVDNEEFVDVDIMDITDPRKPFLTAEYDLLEKFPAIGQGEPGNLTEIFLHDMVVKKVGERFHMAASYWDAGYVVLDVTEVDAPTLVADSDFAATDPELTGTEHANEAPEGNAHQAEWTKDHTHLIGTDEDFSPFKSGDFKIGDKVYPSAAVSGGASVTELEDKFLNGPVTYGGYGCPESGPLPPAPTDLAEGEEKIVVLQRGPSNDPSAPYEACFPGDKAAAADLAGYDAMVLVNHHTGHDASGGEPFCGSGGYPAGLRMPTVCTTHDALHVLFDKPVSATYGPYDSAREPVVGQRSAQSVTATSNFDGWGYVHLFDAAPVKGKLVERDTYAVDEAHDPSKASGFGDLSVHEVATSPTRNDLAYYSYYAAGMRVTKIVDGKLVEVGKYIDPRGSDFWGVEAFVQGGQEYFVGSDRNFGLQIFKYTGN